jgi:hypothetical protein
MLRRILSLARRQQISLVIVGDFEGVDKPAFWQDDALKSSFVHTWALLGKSLASAPAIAGLDLLNEPNPQSATGDLAQMQRLWRTLAESAIDAIRAEHVSLPIVYESVAGASAAAFKNWTPLRDGNVIYSFHFYTPHEITHQHVDASRPRTIPYPAGAEWGLGAWNATLGVGTIDKQRLELEVEDVVTFQRRYHLPVYVGEFSCIRFAPGDSALKYVGDAVDIFNQHGWSWSYHEFRGWPGWDAEIASHDPDVTQRVSEAPMMKLLRASLATR